MTQGQPAATTLKRFAELERSNWFRLTNVNISKRF